MTRWWRRSVFNARARDSREPAELKRKYNRCRDRQLEGFYPCRSKRAHYPSVRASKRTNVVTNVFTNVFFSFFLQDGYRDRMERVMLRPTAPQLQDKVVVDRRTVRCTYGRNTHNTNTHTQPHSSFHCTPATAGRQAGRQAGPLSTDPLTHATQ